MRILNNFDEPYEKFHTKQVHNTKTDSTKDYTVKLSHLKKLFVYFVGIHDIRKDSLLFASNFMNHNQIKKAVLKLRQLH